MITFNVPKDAKLLAAIGTVAIRHGQLDYMLRMTVKSISGIGLEVALDATEGKSSAQLRRLIRKMAKQKLGDASSGYLRLEALLNRSSEASQRRNQLLHGLWAVDIEDGREVFRHKGKKWAEIPDASELDELADEIVKILKELNDARLHGFLYEALHKSEDTKVLS